MTPRGIRNNNPGNIRGGSQKWKGEIARDADGFCIFDSPHNGIRALAKLLRNYTLFYGLNTVRGIINRWAPPVENNTEAYVLKVAKDLRVQPAVEIDTGKVDTLVLLTESIIEHENGQQPYELPQIRFAVAAALGVQASEAFTPHEQVPVSEQKPAPNVATNPVPEMGAPVPNVGTPTEKPVGPFLAFLPSILQMIPQLAAIFKPGDENIAKGVEAAKIVTATLTQSTGAVNLQDAVEKMQADPSVARSAAAAVLTQPEISVLIVEHGGGGVTGARDFLSANMGNPRMVDIIRTVSYWALTFLSFANLAGFALATFLIVKDRDEWQQIVSTLIQADIAATMIALGFWLGATMAKSSATGSTQR